MSKPVLEDLFRFNGRRNRKSYALCSLAQTTAFFLIFLVVGIAIASAREGSVAPAVVLLLAALPFLALVVSAWAIVGQRCRDFGWTGWAALLTLVPYFGWAFAVALCFVRGTPGGNRYGPDPLDDGYRPPKRNALHSRA